MFPFKNIEKQQDKTWQKEKVAIASFDLTTFALQFL
jgi:hypothetical protein